MENVKTTFYFNNVPIGEETISLIKQESENSISITTTSFIFVKERSLFLLWLIIALAVGVRGFITKS